MKATQAGKGKIVLSDEKGHLNIHDRKWQPILENVPPSSWYHVLTPREKARVIKSTGMVRSEARAW